MDRLPRESIHLIVLDMLPGEDGIYLSSLEKPKQSIPIIMVTAKGKKLTKLSDLKLVLMIYISKPFNPRELLARIRAVLRRQTNELPGAPSQDNAIVSFGKKATSVRGNVHESTYAFDQW